MRTKRVLPWVLLAMAPGVAMGQDRDQQVEGAPPFSESVLAREYEIKCSEFQRPLDPRRHADLLLLYLALDLVPTVGDVIEEADRKALDAARTDKPVGADPGAEGTSTVRKAGVPELLAVAVEAGALDRTQNGTLTTFRTNPNGLGKLLSGSYLAPSFDDTPTSKFLSRFDAALTFDSGGEDSSGGRLTRVSFGFQVINNRAPDTAAFVRRFARRYREKLKSLAIEQQGLFEWLEERFAAYTPTQGEIMARLRRPADASGDPGNGGATASADEIDAALADFKMWLEKNPGTPPAAGPDDAKPSLSSSLKPYIDAYTGVAAEQSRDEAASEAAMVGSLLKLDLANDRPEGQPTQTTLSVAFERQVGAGGGPDFTLNADVTLFDERSQLAEGIGSLRKWSLAAQLDFPLGEVAEARRAVFSLSGRFERQLAVLGMPEPETMAMDLPTGMPSAMVMPAVTPPAMFLDRPTNTWLGQAKLTIPISEGGVKVPLSLTWASRSDLVDEDFVRANFGISLDFNSLFGNGARQ